MNTREVEQQKTAPSATPPNGRISEPVVEEDAEERKGLRKRYVFGVIGAIVAILLIVWGIKWFAYARVHEGTDDARVDADVVAATSKINERIDQILVDTNDPVKKGQLLVVLDDAVEQQQVRNAEAQLNLALANQETTTTQGTGGVTQAQADVTNAAAQVPVAQAGVAQAEASLKVAQAQVPSAQAAYDTALADYKRKASLVSTGDVAKAQLDSATATLANAAAQLRSTQDQVASAQANVAAAQSKVGAAQASVSAAQGGVTSAQGKLAQASDPSQVAAAKAQLSIAKQNLGYTHIYSAINGYVGQKSAEVGQTVSAGMTILTLVPDGPHQIYITANYKETQMKDMRVGQPADIHVDAYNATFHGHVESINPASQNTYALVPAQNATGNFVKVTQRIPVRIWVDDTNPDQPLRPGMSVETYVKVR
ncbi:MAG: HlyD family secretion protein [Candidatus Eremiobacteraeota bacterium]|nr:HlyD family secretion protein [Candidatus Eremiobacteraeota bacterium]